MSTQCIAYPVAGGIAVIHPTSGDLTAEQIAKKDVPEGVPYRILAVSDIPTDRTFRDAWVLDFSEPDGFGVSADAWQNLYAAHIARAVPVPAPPTVESEPA